MTVDSILLYLLLAIAASGAMLRFSIKYGFFSLLILLLPFQRFGPDIGIHLKPYLLFAPIFVFCSYIFFLQRSGESKQLRHSAGSKSVFVLWFLFLLLMAVGLFATGVEEKSIRHNAYLWLNALIVLTFFFNISKSSDFKRTVNACLLLGWILGLSGLAFFAAYSLGMDSLATGRFEGGVIYRAVNVTVGRLRSVDWDPNAYAFDLLPLTFLAMARLFVRLREREKVWKEGILIAILVANNLITFSRSGLIGLLVGTTVIFFFSFRKMEATRVRKAIAAIIVLFGSITVIFLALLGVETLDKIVHGYSFRLPFEESRVVYWKGAWRIFLENPFFGVGQGCILEHLEKQVHNTWLELLAENGIFVSLLMFALLGTTLSKTVRRLYDSRLGGSIYFNLAGLLAGMVSMIVMMASISFLTVVYFWFFLAFLGKAVQMSDYSRSAETTDEGTAFEGAGAENDASSSR